MRHAFAATAAAAAFLVPAPAFATGGLSCRPASGSGPVLSLVIGHGIPGGIVGANLTEGARTVSTMGESAPLAIGQSWIDEHRVWLDLVDAQAMRYEGRLRAQYAGRGRARHLAGTFTRNGRLYRVRCEES